MFRDLLDVVTKALEDLFTIRLIAVGVIAGISYCVTMLLIGLPVTLWERFTKKKVNSNIEDKVIKIATIIIAIAFALAVLYQKYI